jgi:hypothetical protein
MAKLEVRFPKGERAECHIARAPKRMHSSQRGVTEIPAVDRVNAHSVKHVTEARTESAIPNSDCCVIPALTP